MLDCGVLHDVEALEETALLLTISWRREKSDAQNLFHPLSSIWTQRLYHAWMMKVVPLTLP